MPTSYRAKCHIKKTFGSDWCHLCGKRSETNVCIWYPDNAEHDKPITSGGAGNYIRICATCGEAITAIGSQQENAS